MLTAAIVTMVLTPLISSQTARIYSLKKRWFRHEALESSNIPDAGFNRHVIIAGGGRVGFQIAQVLKRLSMPFVIIELDYRRFEQAREAGISAVYGDASQKIVLEAAGVKDAVLLILTIPGLAMARSIIVHSKKLNESIQIVARISGIDYSVLFKELGVAEVVLPEFEGSLEITRQALLRLQVPPAEVHRYTDRIRQELYAHLYNGGDDYRILSQLRGIEQQFDLQWVKIDPDSGISNRSIGQSEIRKQTGASVVAVVRNGKLTTNPDADFVLMPNVLVAVIGNDKHREAFCLIASKTESNWRQDSPSINLEKK